MNETMEKQRPIITQLDNLDKQMQALTECIAMLSSRLTPVLRKQLAEDGQTKAKLDDSGYSTVASRLLVINEEVVRQVETVNILIRGIEV